MKRIITLLLTLAMTISLAMPAQAASTKASTMRLMDTVGTATVENAAGKNLSIKDNMRLYNGYEVATKDASYAYISLDSSKAVKLDASSAVKVNQSGKKLELDVTAGELMFNVPVALKSDESLNIRTSTMVIGIRGTAGWVNAMDRYTTRIGVLEGTVTIQSKDPFTGADRSVTIVGGQIATIIRHERANAIQQQLMDDGVIIEENIVAELTKPGQIVEEIQEADIPGFVAQEVSSNSDLQDRIREESPLSVEEITQNAQQKQKDEEKAAALQKVILQEEINTVNSTQPGLPFTEPEVIVITNTFTQISPGSGETTPVPVDMDDPEASEIKKAFETMNVVSITNVSSVDLKDVSIPAGKTLYVVNGTLTNTGDNTPMNGTLILMPDATMNNTGSLSVNSANSLHVFGTLVNEGTLAIPGKVIVETGGLMKNTGAVTLGGSFVINGDYVDTANEVMIQDNEDHSVTFLGTFRDGLTAEEQPVIKLLDKGTLTPNGTISTTATLDLNGNSAEVVGGLLEISAFDDGYSNFTMINSKEFGELTGYVVVTSGGEFNLNSGALVVPTDKVGVTAEDGGTFYINGGIIDARSGQYALALNEDSDGSYGFDGGYLLGTPTPNYVRYHDGSGEGGPDISLWREDSESYASYMVGYREGYNDHYATAYTTGYNDGFVEGYAGSEEVFYNDEYDDGTDNWYHYSDDWYNYRHSNKYALGCEHGTYDGNKSGYRIGYQTGLNDGENLVSALNSENSADIATLFKDILKNAHISGFEGGFNADWDVDIYEEERADAFINSETFDNLYCLVDPGDTDPYSISLCGGGYGSYYKGKLLTGDEYWEDLGIDIDEIEWDKVEEVDFVDLYAEYSWGGA